VTQFLIMAAQFAAVVAIAGTLTRDAAAVGDETPMHIFLMFAIGTVYGATWLLSRFAGLVRKALALKH
jgi:hypothetical protein